MDNDEGRARDLTVRSVAQLPSDPGTALGMPPSRLSVEAQCSAVETCVASDPALALQQAVSLLDEPTLSGRQRARMLRCAGLAQFQRGLFQMAPDFLREGYALAMNLQLEPTEISCLNGLAITMHRLGRFTEAVSNFGTLLRHPGVERDARMHAVALTNLGVLYEDLGCAEEAIALHERALQIVPGGADAFPTVLLNIGSGLTAAGRHQEAAMHLERLVQLARQDDDASVLPHGMAELGKAYVRCGQATAGRDLLLEAAEQARKAGFKQQLALALMGLAELHSMRMEAQAAVEAAQEAVQIAREIGLFTTLRDALGFLAEALARLDRNREAMIAMSERDSLTRELLKHHAAMLVNPLAWREKAPVAAKLDEHPVHFTLAEQKTLLLVVDGLTNKAIAAQLGVSHHTVRHTVASLMSKLGASSRTGLARIAHIRQLV